MEEILHPLIFTHNLQGFYTSKRWLALGFLKHQQLNVRLVYFYQGKNADQAIKCDCPEARAKGLSRHHQSDQPESPWISVYHDGQPWLPSRSLTASLPLKSYRNPIGKDRLPSIIFQGRAVKLPGGRWWFVSNIFYVHPRTLGKMNPIWLLHIFQMGWVKTNYNQMMIRPWKFFHTEFCLPNFLRPDPKRRWLEDHHFSKGRAVKLREGNVDDHES